MKRLLVMSTLAAGLSACYCQPEVGDSKGYSYFSSCWEMIENAPRNQVLFPKP